MALELSLSLVSDDELLRRLADVLARSRRSESDLVAHIGEVDARRLFAREAAPSMFVYCTTVLHLSEAEAYLRIEAARAARKHPELLAMLADGRIHLSGIGKLAPHLTLENRDELLLRATHLSKRQIEDLVAEIAPRPDVRSIMRKLPERPPSTAQPCLEPVLPAAVAPASCDAQAASELRPDGVPGRGSVQPLSPGRYRVQFTAGAELHDQLERLRALLRNEIPDGDLAAVVGRAVAETVKRLEAKRQAKTDSPRKSLALNVLAARTRHVPAAVRRLVRNRDAGQCTFVGSRGRRCPERFRLEYHHRHPYGYGGDHSPENLCLMCCAHNRYLADQDYGKEKMARYSAKEVQRAPSAAPSATPAPLFRP